MLYPLTAFLSAFLLFQIQPMIARAILPWFGGSATLWTVAVLFFQLGLLAAYAYAHVVLHETSVPFRQITNKWRFPTNLAPTVWLLVKGNLPYATAGVVGYTGSKGPVDLIIIDRIEKPTEN